jgi:hypothetical protein
MMRREIVAKPRALVFWPLLVVTVVFSPVRSALAQPSAQPRSLSEDEYRRRDLELRARAIQAEEMKARASFWAVGVPISLALVTLAGSIWAARRTVIAQFSVKAAELALQGEGPQEVLNRAKLLAELYRGLLPRESVERLRELTPDQLGRIVTQAPWVAGLKKELIALLAEHPAQREQIIADYHSMFPQYKEFLKELPPRVQSTADANR